MKDLVVTTVNQESLKQFLELNDFMVEEIDDDILKIQREEELPVFLNSNGSGLYFEVDLGNISSFAEKELYFKLLDLNTEILPVSFGINNSNPYDPRLVLVESREIDNLNNNEILSVFAALELAVEKAETVLSQYIK